jgi:hypothetical protein
MTSKIPDNSQISLRTDPLIAYKKKDLLLDEKFFVFCLLFTRGFPKALVGGKKMPFLHKHIVHIPTNCAILGLYISSVIFLAKRFYWKEGTWLKIPSVGESMLLGTIVAVASQNLVAALSSTKNPIVLYYHGALSSGIGALFGAMLKQMEFGAFAGAFGTMWLSILVMACRNARAIFQEGIQSCSARGEKRQCQNFAKAVLTNHFADHPSDKQQEKEGFEDCTTLDHLSRIIVQELLKCSTEPSKFNLPKPLGEMVDPLDFLPRLKALRSDYQNLSVKQKKRLDLLGEEKPFTPPEKKDSENPSNKDPKKEKDCLPKVWLEGRELAGILLSSRGKAMTKFWKNFGNVAKTIS